MLESGQEAAMSELVLVVLSQADTAPNLLNAAAQLAALMEGGHLKVLAIRESIAVGRSQQKR
jgi:hypothetical protein